MAMAFCAPSAVDGSDKDGAIVLDVDVHFALFLDLADHLAAGADDLADLVGIDVDGGDARRIGRQLRAGLGDGLGHLVQDVEPAVARLGQGLGQDLVAQALDLDVHLQGRDPLAGAGDLEVHVAQVIFQALDVAQDGVPVVLGDQAHGDARHRVLDRHASIHQRQGAAAHRGHRGRAVGG